jgi:hypothetical protein
MLQWMIRFWGLASPLHLYPYRWPEVKQPQEVWKMSKKFSLQSMLICSLSPSFVFPLQKSVCIFLISNFRHVLNVVCFFPGVWIFYANVSEHSAFSIFIPFRLWRWNRQSVPKLWHTKFRRRGITQKKAHNCMHFSSPPPPNTPRVMFTTQLIRLCWITKNNRWTLRKSSVI